MRVVLVAGEASGDALGAGLMGAIAAREPGVRFEGIAGPAMLGAGCVELYPLERLSVMGLAETLGRLPELIRQRRRLARRLLADPPDVFVGIDAPDYNLALERRLKRAGIPTVHYVSPSVWAWRRYRLRRIARSTDLMLTLFPFEADFYREYHMPVRFVGHPMADEIPLNPTSTEAARAELGLVGEGPVVALLPGSRSSELKLLAETIAQAAARIHSRRPEIRFVAPMVNSQARARFQAVLAALPPLPVSLVDGKGRTAMSAADAVLMASGTAALEAMLLKRPMVVTYRVHPVSAVILRRLLKVESVSLPNLLAGRPLVPELLQEQSTPERLAAEVIRLIDTPGAARTITREAGRLHRVLRRGASERAAEAVLSLVGRGALEAAPDV